MDTYGREVPRIAPRRGTQGARRNDQEGRQDDGTGLTYHRSRYYQPATGRFISEDPIGFAGGSNLYTYGANAPTTYTDPTGNNPLLIGCLAGAAIDGGIDYTVQRLSGRKVQWGQVGAAAAQGCALGMLGPVAGSIMKTGRIGADASAAARVADEYTTLPLQNIANGGDTVLGHVPFIEKAQSRGASYFDIGNQWYVIEGRGGNPWVLNEAFLRDRVAAGDRILLSVPKGKIREGTYLQKEIEYLLDNGYQCVNQWALKPKG
ncbi:RHS repeat-associated core domain-containing protein [Promicromonospora alba]|uniref:RHS repeat-associated core domain-containing protein n=1 Tax=Promicromonospora alba TaxID=1616110 RepID=A0ABV9HQQ0_9MICO